MFGKHPDSDFRAALIAVAALVVALMAFAWAIAPDVPPAPANTGLTRFFLVRQDLVGVTAVLATTFLALVLPRAMPGIPLPSVTARLLAVTVAVLMLVLCWAGVRLVFGDYALSRDEQMVGFDAAIFASGRLFATIPANVRDLADALNQTFILPIGDHEAWVSAYLPMNAAIRALFLRLGDATLAAPCMVAIGALALWRIAARLWPDSPHAQIVALLLYAGSPQVWLTGMTAYAMSAHLAFNLLWLALFLKDRASSHALAILVGVVATGLHQVVFHPLFVLPFLDLLLREKRWRTLGAYCAAYTAIGAFWLAWPLWIGAHGVASPAGASDSGILAHYVGGLTGLRLSGVGLMAANLVRFAAWQHLLLLPLAGYGIYRLRGSDPVVRALTLGLILPVVLALVILPYQGHGWGYRYLHGVIGSACLLGGYGWRELERRGAAPVAVMTLATVASIAVMLPLHAAMAHRLVAPFAAAAARRDATPARTIIIDDDAAPFAQDLVLNAPDLAASRLVLESHLLSPDQIAGLCRRGPIAFLDATALAGLSQALGGVPPVETANFADLRNAARLAKCRIVDVPG